MDDQGQMGFAATGRFCHHADTRDRKVGNDFRGLLKDGESRFVILTQMDMIPALQRLDLSQARRDWTMKLWARHSALCLSERARGQILQAPRPSKPSN